MAWQNRKPSIKVSIDKKLFNKLIGVLDLNIELNVDDEDFSLIANKLKNKLLTYSVPKVNNKGEEYVDIRFFPNEASDMIWQLLIRNESIDNTEDFYAILINNREQRKNK